MKKTINTIALMMALLMLAMVFSQAALAEGSYVKTAGNVNVRSGAGTEYRVLGVAFKTYILVESGDALLLIDQHAAQSIAQRMAKAALKRLDHKAAKCLVLRHFGAFDVRFFEF